MHGSLWCSILFLSRFRWAGSLVLYFVQAPWSWSFHCLVGVLASYFWVNLRLLQLSSTWGNSKCHRFLRLYWYYIWWFILRCSFKYYGWQNVCLLLPYFCCYVYTVLLPRPVFWNKRQMCYGDACFVFHGMDITIFLFQFPSSVYLYQISVVWWMHIHLVHIFWCFAWAWHSHGLVPIGLINCKVLKNARR